MNKLQLVNSITVPAALEAIADQTATNQRPFASGVVPTHAVKPILQVIWFYLSCSVHFIYLLTEGTAKTKNERG